MPYSVELNKKKNDVSVLYIKDEETFEEIFVSIPASLTAGRGGSYMWYTGPKGANDFSIRIENYPDEDNNKELNVHTECVSFSKYYPEETIEEITALLDDLAEKTKQKNTNRAANKEAAANKNGQNAGKRKTRRNSH